MALFEKYYNSPKSGSSGVSDFDLPYAYQDLNNEQVGNARSVWKTPLWLNFLTGGVSCSMGYAVWFAYQYNPLSLQTIWIAKFLLVLIGCLFSCASIFLAVFSVFRGQLVLDKNLRELRFYRFGFSSRSHRRIAVDDIETLFNKTVPSPGDSHDPGRDYEILAATLKDGRRA
jgi:hypothetical protein